MPAIVGGQKNPVRLVVGGDDDAAAVGDAELAQGLFVDPQRVGRGGRVGLQVVAKLEAGEFAAEIARLADAQDHRFQKAIEPAEHLPRACFLEVPSSDRVLDRLKQRVFPNTLPATQHQRVIDFFGRPLPPVRKPIDDVLAIVGIDEADVIEPRPGLRRISRLYSATRRPS